MTTLQEAFTNLQDYYNLLLWSMKKLRSGVSDNPCACTVRGDKCKKMNLEWSFS